MAILKRKIKLLLFFLVFIIIAPIIVLYANGDILGDGWSILPTGGIYVTKAPTGSAILLNGKLKDTTSFFERDFLIKNLQKGNYEISVTKDGYNTWNEKISVMNNLVTDAEIFMLPKQITTSTLLQYSVIEEGATTSPTIVIERKNPTYSEVSALFATSSFTVADTEEIFSTSSVDMIDDLGTPVSPIMNNKLGLWQQNGQIYVAWFGDDDDSPEYLCTKTNCNQPLLVYDLKTVPTDIGFLPGFDNVAIIASGNEIFAVQMENYPDKIPQVIYQGTHPDFRIENGNLYVKDNGILSEIFI